MHQIEDGTTDGRDQRSRAFVAQRRRCIDEHIAANETEEGSLRSFQSNIEQLRAVSVSPSGALWEMLKMLEAQLEHLVLALALELQDAQTSRSRLDTAFAAVIDLLVQTRKIRARSGKAFPAAAGSGPAEDTDVR